MKQQEQTADNFNILDVLQVANDESQAFRCPRLVAG